MTEDTTRLVAWDAELRAVHARLRAALAGARAELERTRAAGPADDSAGQADAPTATRDLLLFCHGFCLALDGHHRGEDRVLFPGIAERHPELGPVIAKLEQDHGMIAHLIGQLAAAVRSQAGPDELERHLDGIGAIMESHFRYEERQLLGVLADLHLDAVATAQQARDALGPL